MLSRTASPPAPPPRWRLLAAYAAVYLVWGSTYLGIRFAVETIPPFLMAGSRFLVAGSVLYAALSLRGVPRPSGRQWGAACAVGLLLITFGNGAVSWAEQFIPSSIAALLVATVPVWIALLEALQVRQWPPARAWMGIALGVVGVALLVGMPDGWEGGRGAVVAALAVVAGGWAWAVGSILSRAVPRPANALLAASMHMVTGGAALLILGLLVGETVAPAAVSLGSAVAWGYLVLFGSLVGFTAYVWLLQVDSPTRVSTYAYVNPVIAVLLGWALAAEPFTPRMALAGAAVVAAVVLILRIRRVPAPAPPSPDAAPATPLAASSSPSPSLPGGDGPLAAGVGHDGLPITANLPMPIMIIREEVTTDHEAVRHVNEAAFERTVEADLVDALRRAAAPYLSLVAEVDGVVVGHILFSPVGLAPGDGSLRALGLAPMAVLPGRQGEGVGSALVREGLDACRRAGYDAVFVLGHPDYYPRFGFEPAAARGFVSEYDAPAEAFLVLELRPGALAGRHGTVRYHTVFNEVA